ncbi:MAG: hypothetical protein NVS3B25_04840 [Hymenobacter sp.]
MREPAARSIGRVCPAPQPGSRASPAKAANRTHFGTRPAIGVVILNVGMLKRGFKTYWLFGK